MRTLQYLLLLLLALAITAPIGDAHVPFFPEGNHDTASAYHVADPAKSRVAYGHLLSPGHTAYFVLEVPRGETLRLSLFLPRESETPPVLIVAGPGIRSQDPLPPGIEVFSQDGARVLKGDPPEAEFEPFTPAVLYRIAEYRLDSAEGGEYLVIVSGAREEAYGLAIGYREEFSPVEWVRVPIDAIMIRLWEGQPLWFVLLPPLLVLLVGGVYYLHRHYRAGWSCFRVIAVTAGLLYIGSTAIVLVQMLIALRGTGPVATAWVTVLLLSIPLLLGALVLRMADAAAPPLPSRRARAEIFLLGMLGLVFWAGFILGPVILIAASVAPCGGQAAT